MCESHYLDNSLAGDAVELDSALQTVACVHHGVRVVGTELGQAGGHQGVLILESKGRKGRKKGIVDWKFTIE